MDFGDGIRRHPTQLYEIAFFLLLLPLLYRILRLISSSPGEQKFRTGDAFKFLMVGYLFFRLVSDFIKPYPRIFLGLAGIQWACLLTLLYYSSDVARWLSSYHGTRWKKIR